MSAMEKSDPPVVARKRANNAASAAAEPVERRGGAKENAELQSTVRTQSREAVSRAQARIREGRAWLPKPLASARRLWPSAPCELPSRLQHLAFGLDMKGVPVPRLCCQASPAQRWK